MKFDRYIPIHQLQPYIRHLVISEHADAHTYKVFPATGLVIGFQYKGRLSSITGKDTHPLASAGITGIADTFKIFSNTAGTGTVLVCFTATGFARFSATPAHELHNQSLSLDQVFTPAAIREAEERLATAQTDAERISTVEQFLLGLLTDSPPDTLISEAIRLIDASGGHIRIKDLQAQLYISQSPFEKRFRSQVGTSAKKFASIVRFNHALQQLHKQRSLTEIAHRHHYFDQAHFIKEFKKYTGSTPVDFKQQG